MKRQQYQLHIQTASGIDADESIRMLRAFLKSAIRSYRIKCTSVVRIVDTSEENVEDEPQSAQGANRDN